MTYATFFPPLRWDGFCHLTWECNKNYGEFSIFIHCTFSVLKSQTPLLEVERPSASILLDFSSLDRHYLTVFLLRTLGPPTDLEGFREFWPLIIVCTIMACHSIWEVSSTAAVFFSHWIMVDWHPFVHCWCVAHHKNLRTSRLSRMPSNYTY